MQRLVEIGTVNFDPDVDLSLLPGHLAACLRNAHANSVYVRDDRIAFRAGMFRLVTNLNVLVPFGFGDLSINSKTCVVRYCLSYRQFVVASIVAFGIMTIFLLSLSHRVMSKWMLFFPVLWFFATVSKLMIGISRFQGFISRAVVSAPRVPKRSSQEC